MWSPECEKNHGIQIHSDLQEIGKQDLKWIRAITSGLKP